MSLHPSKLFALLAAASLAGPAAAQSTPPSSAAPRLDLPPVSARPTGQRLPGKVIWFDLLSLDPARARPFYAGVLGWTFEERGTYSIARDGNVPVAGLIPMPAPRSGAPAPQSRWMPLISVSDVARAAATAQAAGGRVLEGPGSLGRRGRYAAVADPRGAQFVLITAAGGDPVDADAPPPGWMWAELWTDDLMGEAAFYKKVVGYEAWQVGSGKQATWIYASGGRPRARASRMPFEKVPSQWLPYVVVKDLPGALVRVAELGGTVLRKPGTKGPQFAVVADPGGAAFILEQRPEQQDEEVAQSQPPPPPPPPAANPDPYGIDAAQRMSQEEAAAQAAASAAPPYLPGNTEVIVAAPAPYANVWIAPPAWGPYWGPGWGMPPGWVGAPWWGAPPYWGPGYVAPGYGAWRGGYNRGYYPGYRAPPGMAPGGPRPPAPGYRPPAPGPGTRGGAPATRGTAPAPRGGSAPATRGTAPAPRH